MTSQNILNLRFRLCLCAKVRSKLCVLRRRTALATGTAVAVNRRTVPAVLLFTCEGSE
jgi:hypothetical protein